ncbi:hemolytic protein [Staphylococcus aureus]|nr:hemolytic protein [Staphylococcus aureus]
MLSSNLNFKECFQWKVYLNAIKDTVTAAINNDGAKLGTSIVSIVENGVGLLGKLFGVLISICYVSNKYYFKGEGEI